MKTRDILVFIVVVLIISTAYIVLKSSTKTSPTAPIRPTPVPYGPITIEGEIGCLPKKGSGMQTLECAIGLRDAANQYYVLANLDQFNRDDMFWGGQKVLIIGNISESQLQGPDGNEYDVLGRIEIEQLELLENTEPLTELSD